MFSINTNNPYHFDLEKNNHTPFHQNSHHHPYHKPLITTAMVVSSIGCMNLETKRNASVMSRRRWTAEENQLLHVAVTEYGTNHWIAVSEYIKTTSSFKYNRCPKQCRERWQDQEDPEINKSPFTAAETKEATKLIVEYEHMKKIPWLIMVEKLNEWRKRMGYKGKRTALFLRNFNTIYQRKSLDLLDDGPTNTSQSRISLLPFPLPLSSPSVFPSHAPTPAVNSCAVLPLSKQMALPHIPIPLRYHRGQIPTTPNKNKESTLRHSAFEIKSKEAYKKLKTTIQLETTNL